MIGLIARLKVDAAKSAQFERDFAHAAAKVAELEPDTLVYRLGRAKDDPGAYFVIEVYRSDEALKAHLDMAHFKTFRPQLQAALLEPPVLERLNMVA